MKDGKVAYVRIKSVKGGRIRIVDQFGGKDLPQGWTRGRTRNSREPTLKRDLAPGETVALDTWGQSLWDLMPVPR